MSASDLLAGTVMDGAAALLNDTAKTAYGYTAQQPYINIALQELREHFELHSIPVTQEVSSVVTVPAGVTAIVYNGVGPSNPALPSDMVEPKALWERETGVDPYVPMTRMSYLPHGLEGIDTGQFIYYVWQGQQIRFLSANRSNDIKIDYIKQLFIPVTSPSTIINVVNAQTFLEYRTAALCAEFIERNKTSADALNLYASLAIDRVSGIGIKGKQSILTRRRPFRASYKRRGWF